MYSLAAIRSPLLSRTFKPIPRAHCSTLIYCVAVLAAGDAPVDIGDCLALFTGAECIPPTGFDTNCTLNFNSSAVYPTASTCALLLTLPTKYYEDYYHFKDKMFFGLMNHGGFGLC